jgi:hypothetical protein
MGKRKTGQRSHVFRVQLKDTPLSKEEVKHVAEAIRHATVRELFKLDFRIEELKPLARGTQTAQCGGHCNACATEF